MTEQPPLSDCSETKQRIAQTYSGSANWDRVQEYNRAMRWHTTHPQKGSHAASTALELPRGRLRTWFNGGKPDAQHAIDTAESHGWVDACPGDPVFEGLTVLHAWVLAGGSISEETFALSLAIDSSDPTELARDAFTAVGFPSQSVNETSSERAEELRPKGPGRTHLGRFLSGVFSAPTGEKTQMQAEPLEFLQTVPSTTLSRWCRTYISLRGIPIRSGQGDGLLRVGEKRTPAYRSALAELFRDVVGEDAHITVTQRAILLRDDALATLDQVPTLPEAS